MPTVLLTLTVQKTIYHHNDADYEAQKDELVKTLEQHAEHVDVEAEDWL